MPVQKNNNNNNFIKQRNSEPAEKLTNIKWDLVILHFFKMLTLSNLSDSLSLKKQKEGIQKI